MRAGAPRCPVPLLGGDAGGYQLGIALGAAAHDVIICGSARRKTLAAADTNKSE